MPPEAPWAHLQAAARQPTIGQVVDDAMHSIDRKNPGLKGVLPKGYARAGLDKQRLGQLIDLFSTIGLGDAASRAKDMLGRVYEYFLAQFASAEGKKGGQFYTPAHVVRVLVEMLAPYKGRVYDPCCGSGGMFVQRELLALARELREARGRGAALGLINAELAFYDALEANDSAVDTLVDRSSAKSPRNLPPPSAAVSL